MVDVMRLVARICEETLQLVAELIGHAEVQRTEIGAERLVNEIFIDAEKEGSRLVAWRLTVTDPEESICLSLTLYDFRCAGHSLNMPSKAKNCARISYPLVYKLPVQGGDYHSIQVYFLPRYFSHHLGELGRPLELPK